MNQLSLKHNLMASGLETQKQGSSLALKALMAFTLVTVGRVQELFPVLMPLHVGDIVGTTTIILFLINHLDKHWTKLFDFREVKYVIGILILAVASVPFSVWPGGSLRYLTGPFIKTLIYFFLILGLVRTYQDCRKMVWALLFCGFLSSFFAVTSNTVGRTQVDLTYGPNDLALFLVCALPFAVFFYSENRGIKRLFVISCIILYIFANILTGSRGGFLALLAVGLFMFLKRVRRNLFVGIISAAAGIILFVNYSSPQYWDRISTILHYKEDYNYTASSGRKEVCKRGINFMLHNPFLGVGVGEFASAEGRSHRGEGKWSAPHNCFVQIGAELGVIGLFLFMSLIYSSMKNMRCIIKSNEDDPERRKFLWLANAIEVSLVGFVVAGIFLSLAYSSLFYYLIGMSLVTKRASSEYAHNMKKQSFLF